jgi:hypothetical protein
MEIRLDHRLPLRSGLYDSRQPSRSRDFYRKAFDFVSHPSRRDDHEDADFYRKQLEEERLAELR